MDITNHIEKYLTYTAARIAEAGDNAYPMQVKIDHTMNVLENAKKIVENENPEAEIGRAALLAALYHDLGRFKQYLRYKTFRDAISCNHGILGVKEIKAEKMLEDENPQIARLVIAAVGLHNRYSISEKIAIPLQFVANVTRDADKLDILRVIDEHLQGPDAYQETVILSLPDDPAVFSQKTIDDVMAGKAASYVDLKTVNDFRLLVGSWLYTMHFNVAKKNLVKAGHASTLLNGLPDSGPYCAPKKKLLSDLAACL